MYVIIFRVCYWVSLAMYTYSRSGNFMYTYVYTGIYNYVAKCLSVRQVIMWQSQFADDHT